MSNITAQISFETNDLALLEAILAEHLGIAQENMDQYRYGLNISVLDCTYEVDYTTKFKAERGIIEFDPLDTYYSYEKSKIIVFLQVTMFSMVRECLPQIAEGVASFMTRKANLKAAIHIEEIPFSVYERGEKIASVKESYEKYDAIYRL